MATTDAVDLLRSIDKSLKVIASLLQQQQGGNGAAAEVADDRDLDGQWGDPEVKFNPRDWRGENCKGRRMSACPAEFLDMIAQTFDYFARKAEENGETTTAGKPVAPYKRKDAARARGWAKRIRAGYVNTSTGEIVEPGAAASAPAFETSEWPAEDEIPF